MSARRWRTALGRPCVEHRAPIGSPCYTVGGRPMFCAARLGLAKKEEKK